VWQQLSYFSADPDESVCVPLFSRAPAVSTDEVCSVPFYGPCPSRPGFGVQFKFDMHHAIRLFADIHLG
jgi:hypothetical protein